MRISLPSHPCSYSVFPEIGRKIRGCIRVGLAFSFYGLSRAQPEMARASKADWVEHMDSRACWYTSCKYDVKQHVECSWLLFLKFVVFSIWHAPCWFFYSWFLGEVTQPFLEPSEGARDRRIRTSAERDKWNGSIFSSLTLTPKLSWSKNSPQLLFRSTFSKLWYRQFLIAFYFTAQFLKYTRKLLSRETSTLMTLSRWEEALLQGNNQSATKCYLY